MLVSDDLMTAQLTGFGLAVKAPLRYDARSAKSVARKSL